jgi:hypothetical protein
MVVGTAIGAGAALGTGALVAQLLSMTRKAGTPPTETEKTVIEYAPLVGAGAVAALGMVAKKFKLLTMPALIGGALYFALMKYKDSKAAAPKGYIGAGRYPLLQGAGNVSRTINMQGAGSVQRVLNAS